METFLFVVDIENVGGHTGTDFRLGLFLLGSAGATVSRASQNFVRHFFPHGVDSRR